jgi:hypothetical protein
MTAKIEYSGLKDGVAIPKRVALEQRLGQYRIEEEFECDKVEHGKLTLDDFTLPHYGLEDADAIVREEIATSKHHMLWIIIANIVILAALGTVIAWRRRSRML